MASNNSFHLAIGIDTNISIDNHRFSSNIHQYDKSKFIALEFRFLALKLLVDTKCDYYQSFLRSGYLFCDTSSQFFHYERTYFQHFHSVFDKYLSFDFIPMNISLDIQTNCFIG